MLAMSEKEQEAQPGGKEGANAGESEATGEGGRSRIIRPLLKRISLISFKHSGNLSLHYGKVSLFKEVAGF